MNKFYKFISWLFHPALILGLILLLAILFSFSGAGEIIKWTVIAVVLSYGIIGTYYLTLLIQQRIDFDVKNVKKREDLFKIAILSMLSFFVLTLFLTEAQILQKILMAALGVNLLYLAVIHLFDFELSVHVGALSVLLIFLVYYVSLYYLLGLIPLFLTIWSRYKLKMHSSWELATSLGVRALIYLLVLVL